MNSAQLRRLASRFTEEDWARIMPKVALVHARTGVVAGKGVTETDAEMDALDVGVMPGGLWVFKPWDASMRTMLMERT